MGSVLPKGAKGLLGILFRISTQKSWQRVYCIMKGQGINADRLHTANPKNQCDGYVDSLGS